MWVNFYMAELHYVDDVLVCCGLGKPHLQTIIHRYLDTHNSRQDANMKTSSQARVFCVLDMESIVYVLQLFVCKL